MCLLCFMHLFSKTTFATLNNILYNSKNSALHVKKKEDKNLVLPIFRLNDEVLPVVEVTKYVGHFFTNDLHDDKDIQWQYCKLYGQGNMLIRKFSICTFDVKVSLFRTFCTPLYTAQLWWNHFDYSLNKLKVAYNDIMRMLLRLPRWHSASEIFVNINVPTCQALVTNVIFKFMVRLEKSTNLIIRGLVAPIVSDVICRSKIWTHWYRLLYVHYDNG